MTMLQKKYLEEYLAQYPGTKTTRKKKSELTEIEKFHKLHEAHKDRLKAQDRARNRR